MNSMPEIVIERKAIRRLIGQNLRSIRESRHLTQEQVAEKVGIAVATYSNIETGSKGMSVYVMIKLAEVLDCPLDSFVHPSEDQFLPVELNHLLYGASPRQIEYIEKLVRVYFESHPKPTGDVLL